MTPTARRPRRRTRRGLSDAGFGLALAAPAVILFGIVSLYPLLSSLSLGFTERSLLSPESSFVGLDNVIEVLTGRFLPVLRTTLVFALGSTLLSALLGLGAALLLNRGIRGQALLRGVLLFPWVTPGVVVAFVWLWIFNANYGVLNGALRQLGLVDSNVHWLGQPALAMVALIVAKSWNTFPWMMVMFLAALQNVPRDLLEAAAADGARPLRRLWHVTLPHLRGVIGVVLLLGVIWNFQHFEIIYVLTEGGPAGATTTFAIELYNQAFRAYDLGTAGAMGIVWMACLAVLAAVYFRLTADDRGSRR